MTKNSLNSDAVAVWCDREIVNRTVYEYGYVQSVTNKDDVFAICQDQKRAEATAKQMATANPGCNVYMARAIAMFTSKATPVTKLVITKDGEVLPE